MGRPGAIYQRDVVVGRPPLSDEEKAGFPDGVDPAKLAPMESYLRSDAADPLLRWRLLQRGLWVHGKETLFDYLAEMTNYELSPVAANITCATLLTAADGDPIASGERAQAAQSRRCKAQSAHPVHRSRRRWRPLRGHRAAALSPTLL